MCTLPTVKVANEAPSAYGGIDTLVVVFPRLAEQLSVDIKVPRDKHTYSTADLYILLVLHSALDRTFQVRKLLPGRTVQVMCLDFVHVDERLCNNVVILKFEDSVRRVHELIPSHEFIHQLNQLGLARTLHAYKATTSPVIGHGLKRY